MMMDYDSYHNMMGGGAGLFMWLNYLLIVVVLILAIVALAKYIGTK